MKKQLTVLFTLVVAFGLAFPVLAAPKAKSSKKAAAGASKEHRYYGDISDSDCGAHHKMKGSAHECTLACVKNGSKYVFVTRGKVLAIANQDDPDLEKYAGEHVRVEGTRSQDSLTISSIAPVQARHRSKKTSS